MVTEYNQANYLLPIAQRYAYNLANGRFLWRNRIGAEQIQVRVRQLRDGKPLHHWTFDARALSLVNHVYPRCRRPAKRLWLLGWRVSNMFC